MEHLLGQTALVIQNKEEVLQQTGGELQEGSGVVEVGAARLLLLQVQQVVHLRLVPAAVANHLVVSGDCSHAGKSQTGNFIDHDDVTVLLVLPAGLAGISAPDSVSCLSQFCNCYISVEGEKESCETMRANCKLCVS